MQRRKKVEVFKDEADEADQKNWRRIMEKIEESGSAVSVLRSERSRGKDLSRDLVLGTLKRFKQLKKWGLVCEVYFILLLYFYSFVYLLNRFGIG